MCLQLGTTCCTSIALSLGCSAAASIGHVISKATRFTYALMLLLASFLAVAMLTDAFKGWILSTFDSVWSLKPDECDGLDCLSPQKIGADIQNSAINKVHTETEEALEKRLSRLVGALAVDRVMLGVAIFHGLLSLALIGVKTSQDARAAIQNGAWAAKLLLYIGLIVGMFFVPSHWFDFLTSVVFRTGAFLFVLVQLAMLVESSYTTYDFLLDAGAQQEQAGRCPWWNWVTLVVTLACYGFVVYVFGAVVAQHSSTADGCTEGIVAVCVVFILTLTVSALSVSEYVRGAANGAGAANGVFQSGIVSAYASYQVLSGMINHPEARCHVFDTAAGGGSVSVKLLGMFFVFAAVLWSAVRTGSHTSGIQAQQTLIGGGALGDESNSGDGTDNQKRQAHDDEREGVAYSYTQFHLEFMLAAMYIAMLLTRWGEVEGVDRSLQVTDSRLSVWIKIISAWLCFGLYTLAMVMPRLFPDREFAGSQQGGRFELSV